MIMIVMKITILYVKDHRAPSSPIHQHLLPLLVEDVPMGILEYTKVNDSRKDSNQTV